MSLKLVLYPSKILLTKCERVTEFGIELHELIVTMFMLMNKYRGVGLAANQIGISKRILLITTNQGGVEPIINPVIKDIDSETYIAPEGCLSLPKYTLPIARPISVSYQYQTVEGETRDAVSANYEARIFLHEYDHLEGIPHYTRTSSLLKDRVITDIKNGKK